MNKNKITSLVIPQEEFDNIINDGVIRRTLTRQSHFYFFHIYFAEYVKSITAPFQREMISITENDAIQNFYCCAFRGSGKSTIITTSYPLWAILGRKQKKFVLLLSQTQNQAKQHMMNIKRELENNELLRDDLGPFQEESDEWGSKSLVFSNTGARITAASSEQGIRGLRHGQHRPDLIIGDDVENMASAKTKEGRRKTYDWLKGEVIPAGDTDTDLVIVGNLLHEDSLLMHIRRDIEEGRLDGVFKAYPLLDENDQPLWQDKYPTEHEIEKLRKTIGDDKNYRREYLLEIVPDDDQVLSHEDIHYYDQLPSGHPRKVLIGVDLAISEKDSADCTAVVSALLYGHGKDIRAYVLPHPINKRMNHLKTLREIKKLYGSVKHYGQCGIYVESVSYQAATVEHLINDGLPTKGVPVSSDKRSRLVNVSHLVMSERILFPRKGAEDLIEQIVGFGKERHDDLVDAFTIVGQQVISHNKPRARVFKGNALNELYRR